MPNLGDTPPAPAAPQAGVLRGRAEGVRRVTGERFVGCHNAEARTLVVILPIPPSNDLTFQVTPKTEKVLGTALAAHAEGRPLTEHPPDRLH
jgi:hypothetical protein